MKFHVPLVLGGLLLVATVAAEAHHSMPNFWYMDQTVEIDGVVQSVKIVNPHPEMVVEVTNPDGTTSTWRITGAGNASAMLRNGWTSKTLTQGLKVKVAGHPSRNPDAKAILAGTVTKPDGTKVEFGAGGGDVTGGRGGRGQ
jgi:hypothetical protein